MATRNAQSTENVLGYLTVNGDRVITATELVDETGGLRNSIIRAFRTLELKYPEHLERKSSTSVIWHSSARVTDKKDGDYILLKILYEKASGHCLGINEDTGKLYKVEEVQY